MEILLGLAMVFFLGVFSGWLIRNSWEHRLHLETFEQRNYWYDKYVALARRDVDDWWQRGEVAPFLRESNVELRFILFQYNCFLDNLLKNS